MNTLFLLSIISLTTQAAVLKRPTYIPDENHPAPERVQMPRQAEEEKPKKSRDEWKDEREQRKDEASLDKKPKLK